MNHPLAEWRSRLEEGFASTWKLLSDTNHFLSRTKIFNLYESQLRDWRHDLQTYRQDTVRVQEIRKEIVLLRKELRQQGYNLMLGKFQIRTEGFRSDDSLGLGYQRVVLICVDNQIYILTGQDNHNVLKEYLAERLNKLQVRQNRDFHSLWYRWDNRLLLIAGADSETKEDYEDFRKDVEDNPFLYIETFRKV